MEIAHLAAERDITRCLVRIARAMDERDWSTLASLMTPDVTAELGTGPLVGPDAVIAVVSHHLDACGPTQHLLGNLLVEVDPTLTTATSRCYVSDMHHGSGDRRDLRFSTLGDYHDRWRFDGGDWRLAHRTKITRGYTGSLHIFAPHEP